MPMKRFLFTYFICTLVIFSLAGCGEEEKLLSVDFNDTAELKQPELIAGPRLNVCIGSMITPEEGYDYYKKLLDYIGEKTGIKVNFIEKRTYAEVNALLKNGGIDMAFVCGGPYVQGHSEFGLELLAAPQVEGKALYYSYIIAASDSGIESLEGLRGKRFAFMDPMSNTGRLIPSYILQTELSTTPDKFFKEYIYTYDHDKSIKAVARGIADGAAVDSLIYNYMRKKGDKYARKTKIIKISGAYGIPPVVVRHNLESGLKARLKGVLLNMHTEQEGMKILSGMCIDKFVEIGDANYDDIRKIKADLAE